MDISQKIILSQKPIQFFKQGVFIKLFNESLYIVNHHYQLQLKTDVAFIHSVNKIIITSGFPEKMMSHYFPQANKTEYGYSLIQSYSLVTYEKWFTQCCQLKVKLKLKE